VGSVGSVGSNASSIADFFHGNIGDGEDTADEARGSSPVVSPRQQRWAGAGSRGSSPRVVGGTVRGL
jgi:hypothetical protein